MREQPLQGIKEAGETMKATRWIGIFVLTAAMLPSLCSGAELRRNFHAVSRLRLEYDDNIYQTQDDEQDSMKFIADIDFSFDVNREQMFLSLRYMPIFIYWDDRPEDDTDLNHAFDGTFKYDFTPRMSVRIKDTFRLSQDAVANPRQTSVALNNDYIYNSLDGTLSYLVQSPTRLSLAGRWITLAYDEQEVADVNDYDIYVGGVTLRHSLRPSTGILADFRYQTVEYATSERDYDSYFLGAGVEQVFSPSLLGSLRAGYQYVEYDTAAVGDDDNPYGDASLTWLPVPRLRLSLVGSYSIDESTLSPYSSQERARIGASIGYDITAKLSAYLAGSYNDSQYEGTTAPEGTTVPDADEDWSTINARLTYQVTERNWLELSYQHTDLDSEAKRDYSRNRGGAGWVYKF
jgi:hypothetical protein